jgi:ribonuclease D
MKIITNSTDLAQFCQSLKKVPYITVDTEFLREKTYYAKLCLIQVSGPDKDGALIDVIEGDIDLAPLLDLFNDENIIKVFHACRQDLEIFYNVFKSLPRPLFDTQIAAMVCGFGEQIGFQPLVTQLTDHAVDKGQQYTDWSKRPLSDKQKEYALDDVVLLVDVYERLVEILEERGRKTWVLEETEALLNPELYDIKPEEAWKRLKVKSPKPRQMAVLREVCAWREAKAQQKDIPKNRILRDETLIDLSYNPPKQPKDLTRIRNFPKGCETKDLGHAILQAVKAAYNVPEEDCPVIKKKPVLHRQYQGAYEMLKMVLKICAAQHDVAPKLVSATDDLEILARDGAKADIMALKGWRKDVFGDTALAITSGEKALQLVDGEIKIV